MDTNLSPLTNTDDTPRFTNTCVHCYKQIDLPLRKQHRYQYLGVPRDLRGGWAHKECAKQAGKTYTSR